MLDHCDQFDGILPNSVELKVSVSQGDADGAVRGSNISRRGTKHEAHFLFMTGLVLGRWTDLRGPSSIDSMTGRKGGGRILDHLPPDKANVPKEMGKPYSFDMV